MYIAGRIVINLQKSSSRPYHSASFFFYEGFFSETLTIHRRAGEWRGPTLNFTLSLPPTHEHWDIYLLLSVWDELFVFLITMLFFSRLLLDEIYHIIELPFDWFIDDAMFVCLLDELILGFRYRSWHQKLVALNSHQLSPLYYKRID